MSGPKDRNIKAEKSHKVQRCLEFRRKLQAACAAAKAQNMPFAERMSNLKNLLETHHSGEESEGPSFIDKPAIMEFNAALYGINGVIAMNDFGDPKVNIKPLQDFLFSFELLQKYFVIWDKKKSQTRPITCLSLACDVN